MKMQGKSVLLAVVALLVAPFLCMAQAPPSAQGVETDAAPFLGRWTGQHEECTSGGSCETRSADMLISIQGGRISVVSTLGPANTGFQQYSKASKGPVKKSFTGIIDKTGTVPRLLLTMPSGTKVFFTHQGNELIGHGSGGRFTVNYYLKKAGS